MITQNIQKEYTVKHNNLLIIPLFFLAVSLLIFYKPSKANSQCTPFEWDDDRVPMLHGSHNFYSNYNLPPAYDEDIDFINDEFENRIARYFSPKFWCYENDETCYLYSEDTGKYQMPLVLYQVSPVTYSMNPDDNAFAPIIPNDNNELEEDEIYIAITYVILWQEDGGLDDPYSIVLDCVNARQSACPILCGWFLWWDPTCYMRCLADPDCHCGATLEFFYEHFPEDSAHPLHTGAHWGDALFLKLYLKANVDDQNHWTLIGIENDTKTNIPEERLSSCFTFSEGCHPNLYYSWGKKHQYLSHGLIDEDNCSGDWLPFPFDACAELMELDLMIPIGADIGTFRSIDNIDHNVGSSYEDQEDFYFIDRLHETFDYLHPERDDIFNSVENAWETEKNFCGGGERHWRHSWDGEAMYLCCDSGGESCDKYVTGYLDIQGSRPVGSRWFRMYDDSHFDGDPLMLVDDTCPMITNDPSTDIHSDSDGIPDKCDNCPYDNNPYQEDSDADGTGDICDLCPNNEGVSLSYHDEIDEEDEYFYGDSDGDTLANICDLCPQAYYEMACGRIENGYVMPSERYRDDAGSYMSENWDGDIRGDRCDNCVYLSNSQLDGDGDTIGNDCDLCPGQNPSDIGTPEVPIIWAGYTVCSRYDCDGICDYFDCSVINEELAFVLLDSKDEPEGSDYVKRMHDWDGDQIGNLCDNCFAIPNNNQRNCSEGWELETRLKEDYPDEDIEGDACDHEPCVKPEYYPHVTFSTHGVQSSIYLYTNEHPCDLYCNESSFDPLFLRWDCVMPDDLTYYAYAMFPLDTHGHNWGDEWDNPIDDVDVMNAYCDCTDDYKDDIEGCRINKNCYEFGEVVNDDEIGWFDLSRIDSDEIENDTKYYDYTTDNGDFENIFRRDYCGNHGQNCHDTAADGRGYYDASDCPGERVVYWDFIKDLGKEFIAGYPRHFFKPDDPEFAGDLILKNSKYHPLDDPIDPIGLPTCPFFELPGGRPPEEFYYSDPISWLPRGEEGCPHQVELKDSVLFKTFPCEMPVERVGQWRYDTVYETSATQGIMIERFDHNNKTFSGFYPSIFAAPEDIIDTEGFSSAYMRTTQPPHVFPDLEEMTDEDEDLRTLWVFGGQDRVSYRNDLWRGTPTYVTDGEITYYWIRYSMQYIAQNGSGSPSPDNMIEGRSSAAMFADSINSRLIIWGGEGENGPLNDLWVFNTLDLSWKKIPQANNSPPPLKDFHYTQAGQRGFIWGGVTSSGELSTILYEFVIPELTFIEIPTQNAPPHLTQASLSEDSSGNFLYLFGGYDGANYHNWLWTLDLRSRTWDSIVSDCTSGTCPYFTSNPVFFGNSYDTSLVAFAGRNELNPNMSYVEEYFSFDLERGVWDSAGEIVGVSSEVGDCNGDGIPEGEYNALCRNYSEWWNYPGREVCDTMTQTLTCEQHEQSVDAVYDMRRIGAVDIDVVGDFLLKTKGNRVFVHDMSDPSSPDVVANLKLRQKTGDIELSESVAAVAAGRKISLLEVSNLPSLSSISDINVCGRVSGIEILGNKLYYITQLGLGEVDISDPELPEMGRFSMIIPDGEGSWSVVEPEHMSCNSIHALQEILCIIFGLLPARPMRPFDVGGGKAFVGLWKDMLVINLQSEEFEYLGGISLPAMIDVLRYDMGFIYLNLFRGERVVVASDDEGHPFNYGTHDLEHWVDGLHTGYDKIFRIHRNKIETAVIE